jgi:hypothetical protein
MVFGMHPYCDHLAFVESVKNKNDVPLFLHFLQENLHLITCTGAADNAHNDLR